MESNHTHGGFTQHYRNSAGFTLIELLVVLAIMTFIMSIALTSQSSFNKTLILQNTAYDIALTLRNAQTYGLSGRAHGGVANTGYGVHFGKSTQNAITLFADAYPPVGDPQVCHSPPGGDSTRPDARPGNCIYDVTKSERVIDYALGNGIIVSDFCVTSSIGSTQCGLSSLDIVFSRPNPDTFIFADGFKYASACIAVNSPQGGTSRFISVSSSGGITANAARCP